MRRIYLIIAPIMFIGLLQTTGCVPNQSSRPDPPPPGGTYISNSAGALFEQSVTLEGGGYIAGLALGAVHQPRHDPATWYIPAQGAGVVVSRDQGKTWHTVQTPLAATLGIVVLEDNVFVISGINEAGQAFVLRSLDEGRNWDTMLTIPVVAAKKKVTIFPEKPIPLQVVTLAQDLKNPDLIYAGSNLGAIFVGEQSAKVWRRSITVPGNAGVKAIKPSPYNEGEYLIVTVEGRLFKVIDEQISIVIFEYSPNPNDPNFRQPVPVGEVADAAYVPPVPEGILVAGKDRSAVSGDGGKNWRELKLPISAARKFNNAVTASSPTNEIRLFVAVNSVLYRSEDAGQTWHTFDSRLGNFMITDIFIDRTNAARMVITLAPIAA